MGKNLIQQRRGKGKSPVYRSNSFTWAGKVTYPVSHSENQEGLIVDIIHSRGHSAPLMKVKFSQGEFLMIAPEGVRVGQKIEIGNDTVLRVGNVLPLSKIPEGTSVFAIEKTLNDGGKFVRSSGGFAKVVNQSKDYVLVRLTSGKIVKFNPTSRATVGIVAGGGRNEKPFIKAGKRFHEKRKKNKLYPHVSGVAMNAVDHPFGGSSSANKGKPTIAPRNAPPGRKVGMIRPKKMGRGSKR